MDVAQRLLFMFAGLINCKLVALSAFGRRISLLYVSVARKCMLVSILCLDVLEMVRSLHKECRFIRRIFWLVSIRSPWRESCVCRHPVCEAVWL